MLLFVPLIVCQSFCYGRDVYAFLILCVLMCFPLGVKGWSVICEYAIHLSYAHTYEKRICFNWDNNDIQRKKKQLEI